MSEEMRRETVLFANERFYHAFNGRDLAAMSAIWAQHAPAICVHPGWAALLGREAVLESWQRILGADSSPTVSCDNATVFMFTDYASVVCYEKVDENRLVAVNGFVIEDGELRMVLHMAGACMNAPSVPVGTKPAIQ